MRLQDLFARGEVDAVSGARRTLVTGLMRAVTLGLPSVVQVGAECPSSCPHSPYSLAMQPTHRTKSARARRTLLVFVPAMWGM